MKAVNYSVDMYSAKYAFINEQKLWKNKLLYVRIAVKKIMMKNKNN